MPKVHFETPPNPEFVTVHFDKELHVRGTDFTVWRNNVHNDEVLFQDGDSNLLRHILINLIYTDDSGVSEIRVKSYQLTITKSRAVSLATIKEAVCSAAELSNIELTEVNELGHPRLPSEC